VECTWQRIPEKEKGIIVGCDEAQEWLLSWWWERYSAENRFPVMFADFGMSGEALAWCQERGEIAPIQIDFSSVCTEDFPCEDKAISPYGPELFIAREKWFKKPFACLASPFQRSIWIDLDCEVLRPIDALFDHCNFPLALRRSFLSEQLPHLHPEIAYNSGVIAFMHGAEIIQKWAEGAISRRKGFMADDFLLSSLIFESQWPVRDLADIYNWECIWELNFDAVIYHWIRPMGKEFIKKHGGIKPFIEVLRRVGKET
jgi:hypothetical protein